MDKHTTRVKVRDAHRDDVKATTINEKEKEKMTTVYEDVYKPKFTLALHKTCWCARPRPGDARSTMITILACSLLHNKIEHQTMLLLGP